MGWVEYRRNYLSAYEKVYNAECYAVQQVEVDPTSKEAKQNIMSSRVAGYLLGEFFNRHAILSEGPCASLVKQLTSSPQEPGDTDHDLVFNVGKWHHEYFLRLCTFDCLCRSASQFPCNSDIYRAVPSTIPTPFVSLLQHPGGYDKGLYDGRWQRSQDRQA